LACAVAALLVSSMTLHARAAPPKAPAVQRMAVVVGANEAAPGRKRLRYSHSDAAAVAQVLTQLGGFAASDVTLLLDPDPALVVRALETQLARAAATRGPSLIFFYYSGHADTQALYPRGRPLLLSKIRELLDDTRATVRVGLVDACRGGGWTGTKGLSEAEVFEVNLPLRLNNEGSVFIASSSGLEDAHESEALGGSYFTHHWNAALRGTADRNADGVVTLNEAFDYAKTLTIRDTALVAEIPQHPSYHLNLRGRQDLPIARLHASRTALALEQTRGPLQIVHLETGQIVLEVPPGERRLKLVVPPGRYLVRRVGHGRERTHAREIIVRANAVTPVREQDLELVGNAGVAIKRAEPRPITRSTVPDGMWDIEFALGVAHQTTSGVSVGQASSDDEEPRVVAMFNAAYGITDRWQWLVPTLAFAYRGGEHGGFEWIPAGGVVAWGFGYGAGTGYVLSALFGARVDLRYWFSPRSSVELGAGVGSILMYQSGGDLIGERYSAPDTWRGGLSLSTTHTLADAVTLSVGAAVSQNLLSDGALPSSSDEAAANLTFGSVARVGYRSIPLVRVHVSDVFSLDAHVGVGYSFATQSVLETYMLGASFIW
jgi:hypothetical protein